MKKFIFPLLIILVVVVSLLMRQPDMELEDRPVTKMEVRQEVPPDTLKKTASSPRSTGDNSDPVVRPPIQRPLFNAPTCPVHLRSIFGLDGSAGYVQRKRIVESLGKDLSPQEIDALYAYLYFKSGEVGLGQNGYDALGDVIMLKLEEQMPLPPDYTDHLVLIYADKSRSGNWRDYCIQHLGTTYARTAPEKQPAIRQLFMGTIGREPEMAGTTLLAMKNAGMEQALVSELAMTVASGSKYPDSSRLSSLHVAADANHPEALPLARTVAVSKQTVHFRMAAMAVIGKLGDRSDLPMLTKYTNSSDIRLRESSKTALRTINDRESH